MKTGEGKTLVATLPSYLNALTGKGVHVVTVNDYLAKYQSEQMGRVHHFLGLSTGVILQHMTPAERRVAYAADITYGTNNEFGFDYLRDNMALSLEDCVQRGHHYAIVDEVDSILVDEARTPLIISGPAEDNKRWYPVFSRLAKRMIRDTHYEVDEKKKTISVLEPGIALVEDRLGIDNLYESANTPLISYLNNAIRAKELFKRDKDYMVTGDGEVLIVDEFTGRTLAGRRYSEGLHQALEAKEGVEIKEEFQTLATITLQNYFRMYDKLAGMTGTAKTEESEFQKIYGLGVLPIPTNKPMVRADQPDLIYRTEEAKYDAIVADVVERHAAGQPVLLGTASVAKSEVLSAQLKRAGVPHEVLNAKNHAREAAIIALAGRKGAVTVATNMAGRGTDIILGGNAEFLADATLRAKGLDPVENPEEYEAAWPEALAADRGAGRRRARGGRRPGRPVRHRLRAPRVPPHRQPAAWPVRPPGRPGRVALLPVAAGRPDAPVQGRPHRARPAGPQRPRRRAHREQAGHQLGRQARRRGRGAELRDAQERPQVRRRDEPPAPRDLRRPPRVLEGADVDSQPARRDGQGRRAGRPGPHRGLRRGLGPRAAVDRSCAPCTRWASTWPTTTTSTSPPTSWSPTSVADAQAAYDAREEQLGSDVMREVERRAADGARPQVARAPLRDGLPARGHRPAGDGAARPAGGVPARGRRDVQRHDGRLHGGGRRVPVQPRGSTSPRRRRRSARRGRRGRRPRARRSTAAARARRNRPTPRPDETGGIEVHGDGPTSAAAGAADPGAAARPRRAPPPRKRK